MTQSYVVFWSDKGNYYDSWCVSHGTWCSINTRRKSDIVREPCIKWCRIPILSHRTLGRYLGIRAFPFIYLIGQEFTIISDHKQLETIFINLYSKPPARIMRWRLKLQPYPFQVQYLPGKSNAADYMLRHPSKQVQVNNISFNAEEYINYVAENAVPKALTLSKISK